MKARFPLCPCVAVILTLLLASCASVREQKYLPQGQLTKVQNVVVLTSSKDIHVSGDQGPLFTILGLPFGPIGIAAGLSLDAVVNWGVGGAVNAHRSAAVQARNEKETIAQRLSGHFTRSISAGSAFSSIEEASAGDGRFQSPNDLCKFDAVLRLKITELSLRPVTQDEWGLFLEISAEMVSLKNGKEGPLLWSRSERLASVEVHTLEFYKTQGIPMLDASLASLAHRLAGDLVYSK